MTKLRPIQWLLAALLMCTLVAIPAAQADDLNYYNFDWEDFWKEYKEWGYPDGTRMPCNGSGEYSCTWAWQPWYEHNTDIPRFDAERYTGRTVSGYALMMYWYGGGKNIDGGVFRRESVQPCHTYRFTMWARSGLEPAHPPSTNAHMQVGISATGDYPDQVVLTPARIAAITWSAESNSQYVYQNLSVQVEAQSNTVAVFTRANPEPNNEPYTYWDEGSFTDVARQGNLIDASQPLPAPAGGINNVQAAASSGQSAQVSWDTGSASMLGQVLYRAVGSTQTITPTATMTYHVYIPYVAGGVVSQWQYSAVDTWGTAHLVALNDLQPSTIYEYVVVNYGYTGAACGTLVSETSEPRKFQTP